MNARHLSILCVVLALLLGGRSVAQELDPSIEDQVKAAFLYNFTKFVVWPEDAFGGPEDPVRIGVLSDRPLMKHLQTMIRGKTVRGRPIVAAQIDELESSPRCHILFVGATLTEEDVGALEALKRAPVLIVGAAAGFASRTGVINFVPDGAQMQLEINPAAAESSGLRISSRLLSLATLVSDPE